MEIDFSKVVGTMVIIIISIGANVVSHESAAL